MRRLFDYFRSEEGIRALLFIVSILLCVSAIEKFTPRISNFSVIVKSVCYTETWGWKKTCRVVAFYRSRRNN